MTTPCTLGVGCDETGVCYAGAHGDLSQCGRIDYPAERAKAEKDSQAFGMGFLVDGLHVALSRVTMIRKAHWPHVTTTELYNDLAQVLLDKGASEEWTSYVMGDLLVSAAQYAHTRWLDGYHAACRGEPIPNPQGPPKTGTGTCRDGA